MTDAAAPPTRQSDPEASLTVIVPTFNGAATIGATIDALSAQDDPDFDILYVDDASTDGTDEIVARRLRPRDRLVRKPNSGLYATLNFAVEQVEVDWVVLLFQDDTIEPSFIAQARATIAAQGDADCIWFGINLIDSQGRITLSGREEGKVDRIAPGVEPWRSALVRGTFWTISGSVTRRTVLSAFPFDPKLPHCGDYDFLLRTIRCHVFCYVGQPLVNIRIHEQQASAGNLQSGRDLRERMSTLERALASNGVDAPVMLRLKLAWTLAHQIVRRSIGSVARGRIAPGVAVLATLPRTLRLVLPK